MGEASGFRGGGRSCRDSRLGCCAKGKPSFPSDSLSCRACRRTRVPAGFHFQLVGGSEAAAFWLRSAWFLYSTGNEAEPRAVPGHSIWMWAPTHGPRRERAGNGLAGAGHGFGLFQISTPSPHCCRCWVSRCCYPLNASPKVRCRFGRRARVQGNPQTTALITSLYLGPSAEARCDKANRAKKGPGWLTVTAQIRRTSRRVT